MKLIRNLLLLLFAVCMLISCEYETIEFEEPVPPDPEDTISFAQQIEPIFISSQCTNCHSGSLPLDLTTGNSYASIVANGTVVAEYPDSSKIYTYPHPVTGNHKDRYKTVEDADLIYGWIFQGALDN